MKCEDEMKFENVKWKMWLYEEDFKCIMKLTKIQWIYGLFRDTIYHGGGTSCQTCNLFNYLKPETSIQIVTEKHSRDIVKSGFGDMTSLPPVGFNITYVYARLHICWTACVEEARKHHYIHTHAHTTHNMHTQHALSTHHVLQKVCPGNAFAFFHGSLLTSTRRRRLSVDESHVATFVDCYSICCSHFYRLRSELF